MMFAPSPVPPVHSPELFADSLIAFGAVPPVMSPGFSLMLPVDGQVGIEPVPSMPAASAAAGMRVDTRQRPAPANRAFFIVDLPLGSILGDARGRSPEPRGPSSRDPGPMQIFDARRGLPNAPRQAGTIRSTVR